MSYNNESKYVEIEDMLGKTFTKIEGGVQDDVLKFYTECGYVYTMFHSQACCESVYVEDISGDFKDLIGEEITEASCVSQDNPHASESGTWTFYKLNSRSWRGGVCIRWNGESNGYYSESVDLIKEKLA